MRIAARAPNHLGDGVMALPALVALARRGTLTIHGPRWARDLYRDLDARVLPTGRIDGADVAVLLAPSLRAAWEARRVPRRIGVAWDGRRPLLTDVVAPALHTADTYGRLAARAGATVDGKPSFSARDTDAAPDLPLGHIGLDPTTGQGAVKEWPGFRALAEALDRPVVFYGGPGEYARVRAIGGAGATPCVGLPLPSFAAALRRCAVYVANDSGGAHFAAACGVPTVVVHGPTTAARTGPRGARPVSLDGPSCRPCYAARCARGDHACLRVPVADVLAAIREVGGG